VAAKAAIAPPISNFDIIKISFDEACIIAVNLYPG
jgi:hypothetical protein